MTQHVVWNLHARDLSKPPSRRHGQEHGREQHAEPGGERRGVGRRRRSGLARRAVFERCTDSTSDVVDGFREHARGDAVVIITRLLPRDERLRRRPTTRRAAQRRCHSSVYHRPLEIEKKNILYELRILSPKSDDWHNASQL